jgi:hypothetical protein
LNSPPSALKSISGLPSSSSSHRVARKPIPKLIRPEISYEQHAAKFFGLVKVVNEPEAVVSPIQRSEEEVDELEGDISPVRPSENAGNQEGDGEDGVQEEDEDEVEEQAVGNLSEILGSDDPAAPWVSAPRVHSPFFVI